MDDMVKAPRRTEKSSNSLRKLLGRQIVVPAKTVGLSDAEQSLQGKVVDTNQEENSLWCTVSGDKRWYSWHVDEVTSWLVEQTNTVEKSVSMPVMSARRITKQTSNGLLQSSSSRPQPPHTAGAKSKPRAPGSEHLWKFCKRCNTWKERPGDFSKNHRTPDGLQFYCRFCHNRMTKFNQQRRLEEQHIAEKHLQGIRSPKKHTAKPATAKSSPFSNAGVSPASKSLAPPFDVIGSKIPRQQRTHATYRKDSDPLSSAERCQTVSPPRSPTGRRTHTAPAPAESTVGSDNGKSKQGSLGSSKKSGQRAASIASRPKLSLGPTVRPEAQVSAELMLQANAVLEEFDRVQAAEAAATAATTAAAAAAATTDASVIQSAASDSLGASSQGTPASSLPPSRGQVRSEGPQQQACLSEGQHSMESMQGGQSRPEARLQRRASSLPVQQDVGSSTSAYSLSQTESQIRQACHLDSPTTDLKQPSLMRQLPSLSPDQAASRSVSDPDKPRVLTLGHGSTSATNKQVSEAASPQLVSVSRINSWFPPTSVSPAEQARLSPEAAVAAAAAAGDSSAPALLLQLQAGRLKDLASFSVPRPLVQSVSRSLQEQASPELQQAASEPAAAPSPKAALKIISRAKSSPPGQLALSVAEGNSEGAQATNKGKPDAWSFPTGHPLARTASGVELSNAEPLPKRRKLSASAAATEKTTLATSSPVESCAAAAAASKPDGPSTYGFQSRLKPQDMLAERRTSSSAAPSLPALPTEDPLVPFSSTPEPSAAPMLPLTAAGIFGSTGDVFSAYASLTNVLSPQQLQEFLITLTKPGQGDLRSQVTASCSHASGTHAC
ncbi:TPA: hypothetical protein ACH3X1_011039 [Trebouxia sp. C0004]